jgi:hypothetical protein
MTCNTHSRWWVQKTAFFFFLRLLDQQLVHSTAVQSTLPLTSAQSVSQCQINNQYPQEQSALTSNHITLHHIIKSVCPSVCLTWIRKRCASPGPTIKLKHRKFHCREEHHLFFFSLSASGRAPYRTLCNVGTAWVRFLKQPKQAITTGFLPSPPRPS